MRGRGFITVLAGALALAGCKTGDKRPDEPSRVPGEPASRPKPGATPSKDPLTNSSWLDAPAAAGKDATPPAGTWTNPNDPGYDYQAEARGQLGGTVEDAGGRKVANAHVRVEQSDGKQAKPYGVYTTADGSFLLPGLKPGTSYAVTVEARDDGRSLVGRAVVKAPNVRLLITVREGVVPKDRAGNTAEPLPPPGRRNADPLNKPPPGALPVGEPLSGPRPPTDLPAPVPLGQDTRVFPPAGSDLPRDYSPTEPGLPPPVAPPPAFDEPVPTVRPELMTGDRPPDWKAPTATIPPPPAPPVRNESRRVPKGDQFQVVDVLNRTRTFPSGRPGELILLDFTSTNCLPCRKAIPTLTALQEKYAAKGFEVVAVLCDDESLRTRTAYADRYRKAHDLNYQVYAEASEAIGPLLKRFDVKQYPTVVLLNASGSVVWQGHPSKTQELVAAIEGQLR